MKAATLQMVPPPTIVVGDVTQRRDDAIVNPWNRNLFPWWLMAASASGVSGALRKTAGFAPFRELSRHPLLPLGAAVATGPGRLPVRAIIHVAGIDLLWRASERSIRLSTRNAVRLAESMGFASLAVPVIGSGSGGFPAEQALTLMLGELALLATPVTVTVVRFAGQSPGSATLR